MDATKAGPGPLRAWWLGRVAYRDAWELQHRLAAMRAEGVIPDQLLLLEHEPVLTLGRNADAGHVRVAPAELERRGIELIRVERGGEVTYHGPGQLVAYPILALRARGLLLRPFVAALEGALSDTCAAFGVAAGPLEGRPGCWCDTDGPAPRKIGALGIRVQRGVTYHGIALNVSVDLSAFALIDACGMPGVESTSIAHEAGRSSEATPTDDVARAAAVFAPAFAERIGAALVWAGEARTPGPATVAATGAVPRESTLSDVLGAVDRAAATHERSAVPGVATTGRRTRGSRASGSRASESRAASSQATGAA